MKSSNSRKKIRNAFQSSDGHNGKASPTTLDTRFAKARQKLNPRRQRLVRAILDSADETCFLSSREMAKRFHIDATTIHMVTDPGRFDVIVTDNLFGDILTDLGAAVAGGIGLAASANLNPARTGPSMFEPVHGSAPDIVGTGQANPLAAIRSAAMMLEFLGEGDAAARITKAVAEAGDLTGSTTEIGDAIAARV